MVAKTDEGPNAGVVESLQAVDEGKLSFQASVRSVIEVAHEKKGIDFFFDAEADDVLVRLERGVTELAGDGFVEVPDARKGAVEVEVGSMDKAETGHDFLRLFGGDEALVAGPDTAVTDVAMVYADTPSLEPQAPVPAIQFTFQDDH